MPAHHEPARLLIAEDDAALAAVLLDAFREAGYEVAWAPDGVQAIAMLEEKPFDLVLADVVMPGADGLRVLERARAAPEERVVILMTGYSTVQDALEAVRKGAWDFVGKPFSVPELLVRTGNARRYQLAVRRIRALEEETVSLERELARMRGALEATAARAYRARAS